jgi:hypothetical protein
MPDKRADAAVEQVFRMKQLDSAWRFTQEGDGGARS